MAVDPQTMYGADTSDSVAMPRPTVAPLVLALGLALMAAGVAMNLAFLVVGSVVFLTGLGTWIAQFLPGWGEHHEPLADRSNRPQPVRGKPGGVGRMQEGMPGSRLQLPTEVHPISAGVKGGILGGLLMPIPAVIWGLASGHGVWYPVNLLAGMLMPGVDKMSVHELEQFSTTLLGIGLLIHAVNSVTFGMIYGVLMPTLPDLPRPIAWGGLAMPMLWTALTYGLMRVVNPLLAKDVDWPSFIAAQFVFGIVAATTVNTLKEHSAIVRGLIGGVAGGLLMPIPAVLWGFATGHGIWYPANLLAAMVIPGMDKLPTAALETFHPGWLVAALVIHATMSLGLGAVFGLFMLRLRPIPSTLAWGGLLMPMLWTSMSYSLMGVVNPLLQEKVSWPWFVASQFVFGLATAYVVERSERVYIPPAGEGEEPTGKVVAGSAGGES